MDNGINKGSREGDCSPQWKNVLWVAAILLVVSFAITGYAWARKEVQLVDDGKSKTVTTFAQTVGQLLADEGVTLGADDRVEPSLDTPLKKDMQIIITRAFPVTVRVDDQVLEVNTIPVTVREVLRKARVSLEPEDRVTPGLEEQVHPGTEIIVTRITTEEIVMEEEIPYQVVRERDPNLERGQTKVIQKGRKGLLQSIYRITYANGVEINRELVSKTVVKAPVEEKVVIGDLQVISRGGVEYRFREARIMEATAYSHTGQRTSTGSWPQRGTIAVDPKVIPLGSRLYVEGYGPGVAEDVGSAIKGNKIDVFVETEKEARQWGRRKVKVYILQ
ncbi:MAG TPA: DUF348 domain-containing protein [Clostridia bacterium]|nr:DUF348 domain-containing protein [Clostridia bacterium]